MFCSFYFYELHYTQNLDVRTNLMPATYIINGTIQDASTAQDAVADGNDYIAVVIQATGGDLRVNVGANASASAGETVYEDTSSTFTALSGKRISVWSTTDAMTYSIRLAQ